ncbi:MAG: response regulator [Clostridia bacterium]|nr:response regulator [Clostridia bacterium]
MTDQLKVLIVDDEHLIRNLLKMRIDWEEIGMEIAGEAASAKEALELVDSIIPDIIFTDICMPFMDGIEFSKIVIEKYPHIKIVIVTGHDEFEYAKRSIKLGISDFLLKPINKVEIKKVALDLKEKIESQRTHKHEYDKLKLQLEESLPYIREKVLNELLQSELNQDEISKRLNYFKIGLNPGTDVFQIAVVEVSSSFKDVVEGEEQKILLDIQCADIIRQTFREDEYVTVFYDYAGKIVILSNNEELDLTDCCEMVKICIINKCKCFISIGIGNKVNGLSNIKLSYSEACDALNYKVVVGKNQVVNYNDINFNTDSQWRVNPNKIEKLNFYIKTGIKDKASEFIDETLPEFFYCRNNAVDKIRLEAFDILLACQHAVLELNISTAELWGDNTQPYSEISKIDNLPELKDYLRSLVSNIIDKIHSSNEKKANKLINQILEHIQKNIHESELSLSGVAKEFFISPSHLSRLFKQETQQTFVEYITKMRMEKAVRLLKETDMKVYQVGEMVGIADPHYFSILFKKFTGVSVNDFRKI